MPRRKVTSVDLIRAYRGLMLEESRRRLGFGFRPFVAMLRILDGGAYLKQVEVDVGTTDAEKDEFVEQVRQDARECEAIAVWFGARGWTAPAWKPRPSRHPERKRQVMLFESSRLGDKLWTALVQIEMKDGSFVLGRWYDAGAPSVKRGGAGHLGGRFVNLLGAGPRLVRSGKEQSHAGR